MSLNGVESSNGYLEGISDNGTAVSEQIVQDGADLDFKYLKNISTDIEFGNISLSSSANIPIHYNMNNNNVTPSQVVTSSNSSTNAYLAFTTTSTNYWQSENMNTAGSVWVAMELLDGGLVANHFAMRSDNTQQTNPYSWIFQGSNDGIVWDDLYSRTNYDTLGNTFYHHYFNNTTEYSHYRIYITGVRYPVSGVRISGMYIYHDAKNAEDTLFLENPLVGGEALTIVKEDDSIHHITATATTANDTTVHPIMTSASQDGYIITSSESDTQPAYYAFNGIINNTNSWRSGASSSSTIAIELPTAQVIDTYTITSNKYLNEQPTVWYLDGSNDNVGWFQLDYVGPKNYNRFGTSTTVFVELETKASEAYGRAFKYYRLRVTDNGDGIKIRIADFKLKFKNNSLDTTSITAGEVPSRVYKVQSDIEFNDTVPNNASDVYSIDTDLKSTRSYDDVSISGRTLETKVTLQKGNKVVSITGDIWKET